MIEFLIKNPILSFSSLVLLIILTILIGIFISSKVDKIKFKDFELDLRKDKESSKDESKLQEIKYRQEERLRTLLNKQIILVHNYLQNFKPLTIQLITSVLEDAVLDSLNIIKEQKVGVTKKEPIEGSDDYYTIETIKTFHHKTTTRTFIDLIESCEDSLLKELEIEITRMLINNNIGKNKDQVKFYIKNNVQNIIGLIRNYLSNVYTNLSGKSLFDFHKYFPQMGIHYPEDYVEDKLLDLFIQCMNIRYYDFT